MKLYKKSKLLTNLTLSLTLAALIPVSSTYADCSAVETTAATMIVSNTETMTETLAAEAEKAELEAQAAAEKAAAELEAVKTTSSYVSTAASSYETSAYTAPSYTESASGDQLTASKGVVYYNGHRETYYSQKVLPGNGLDIPGRHVAEDGTVRDADNYICVASSDLEKGSVVETSLGTAKVYDSGCASGTVIKRERRFLNLE